MDTVRQVPPRGIGVKCYTEGCHKAASSILYNARTWAVEDARCNECYNRIERERSKAVAEAIKETLVAYRRKEP